ncbi:related to RRP1 protein [Ramularia collo-cygni]|uniref:Related to RRP1 protein n=1 Tax=Ramularia collo-cygni TaxID=112498 RepID=A0A2D3VJY5_9PEZI|nr:related to RRP1 protein [Ramularia collo-cygni]CZT24761.1 related to RRP1 protein [Ramularia collo-cygni]
MASPTLTQTSQSNPFIRQLASSNRTTRDKALASLRTYLQRSTAFSELDLLKLWKGLHYCMFMSDKPRNQQQLARDLAALVDVLKTSSAQIAFISAFWKTMAREWSAIDSLRMDKYLYLLRCYISKGFEVCSKSKSWKKAAGEKDKVWEEYVEILVADGGPLSPQDLKVPVGIRLHVLDIWVDELENIDTEHKVDVEKVMAPVTLIKEKTLTKSVRVRADEALEDERILSWNGDVAKANGDADKEDVEEGDFAGFDD